MKAWLGVTTSTLDLLRDRAHLKAYFLNDAAGAQDLIDDSEWVLAYQLGAGLAYQLSPGLDVTAEYRYFRTEDATLKLDDNTPGDADLEYRDHSVVLGLRYSFQ